MKTNQCIMNIPGNELSGLIKEFLNQIDDHQQLAGDNNDEAFSENANKDFIFLENLYLLSLKSDLSQEQRNEIRMTMKDSLKFAGQYLN